jgi:D-alanine--poly(phosphoribitol) ligase subunit 1
MIRNIIERLEMTAESHPDALAFSDMDTSLSWNEVKNEAKRIGGVIASRFPPLSPVPVLMEKSVSAVTSFLASAYAGCPYASLDPSFPTERLHSMLATLCSSTVLTTRKQESKVKELGVAAIYLEDISDQETDEKPLSERRDRITGNDPLYIMFTSGSTGKPKGVVVSHRSVLTFIDAFVTLFSITDEDRIANQAPFDFDVSVKDIYSAVFTGASVHLVPRQYFSFPAQLLDFLEERHITTIIWAVSAMCLLSMLNGFSYKEPKGLRKILFSGEVMPPKQLAIWMRHVPDAQYVNLYGPTEITCNCMYYRIKDWNGADPIPLGVPFPDEKVFLLDENGRQVTQKGETGEICVSGPTLALGYYNDQEKTKEAFVQNPLVTSYEERIYKSGDLATIKEDGSWLYAGRKDFQVKHMGHRIELTEIDGAVDAVEGVSRSCCLLLEGALVDYYVGKAQKGGIIKELRTKLPAFMIPTTFMNIASFPLTKNGKIDRNALKETYATK